MAARPEHKGGGGRIVPSLALGAGCLYARDYLGPVFVYGDLNIWAGLAALGLVVSGATLASGALHFLSALNGARLAKQATGFGGTSGFITSLKELRHELIHKAWGPYWGSFKGKELIVDYVSNALTVAPAGTGKDVGVVQPTALAIHESKTIVDKKGTSACVLGEVLKKRGEVVHYLNLADTWSDILGPSSTYNPLCWITDNFWEPGCILDVMDDAHAMSMQLLPEPSKSGDDGGGGDSDGNKYFRDGSRDLISFAIQACILIKGREATLGDVTAILSDRQSLHQHARWIADRLVVEDDIQTGWEVQHDE